MRAISRLSNQSRANPKTRAARRKKRSLTRRCPSPRTDFALKSHPCKGSTKCITRRNNKNCERETYWRQSSPRLGLIQLFYQPFFLRILVVKWARKLVAPAHSDLDDLYLGKYSDVFVVIELGILWTAGQRHWFLGSKKRESINAAKLIISILSLFIPNKSLPFSQATRILRFQNERA